MLARLTNHGVHSQLLGQTPHYSVDYGQLLLIIANHEVAVRALPVCGLGCNCRARSTRGQAFSRAAEPPNRAGRTIRCVYSYLAVVRSHHPWRICRRAQPPIPWRICRRAQPPIPMGASSIPGWGLCEVQPCNKLMIGTIDGYARSLQVIRNHKGL